MSKTYINYHLFHQHVVGLSQKLKPFHFDYIVAPSRGGLIPGVILSHTLNIPLVPIEWSTRDYSQKNHRADIAEDLADGKEILLVDDINDTGRTFIELIDDWGYNNQMAGVLGTLTTASVFQRYNTQRPSNHYQVLVEDDSWIVFPWEC